MSRRCRGVICIRMGEMRFARPLTRNNKVGLFDLQNQPFAKIFIHGTYINNEEPP